MTVIEITKDALFVGRRFFIEPQGNAKHYWHNSAHSGTVTRMGRKYFYVSVDGFYSEVLRFEVNGGAYAYEQNDDCNANYILYDSEEEYMSHLRADAEKEKIRRYVRDTPFERFPDNVASSMYKTLLENGLVSAIQEGSEDA